jgi:hypothetical protein
MRGPSEDGGRGRGLREGYRGGPQKNDHQFQQDAGGGERPASGEEAVPKGARGGPLRWWNSGMIRSVGYTQDIYG